MMMTSMLATSSYNEDETSHKKFKVLPVDRISLPHVLKTLVVMCWVGARH